MKPATYTPSPSSVPWTPATFARYLDVLEAEHDQAVMELQTKCIEAMDGNRSDTDVAFDVQERAEHLRNVTWTMLVQARALLGVS